MADVTTSTSEAPERRTYLIGLVLALILTAIPFGLVSFGLMPVVPTLMLVALAAIVQVLVHLRYFLHLDLKRTPRENLLALAFAALLIFLMVGGTLWIMFDLHYRMML
jgi:cytochrome o ubiquinol oxidase operon protein cyoD